MKILDPMLDLASDVYFTSDNHFFHKGVMTFCKETREGADVEEMNTLMVQRWNKRVRKNDRVFCLGDFSFHKDIEQTRGILAQLNGQITIIRGNHDYQFRDKPEAFKDLVKEIVDYKEINLNKVKIILSHYPMVEWNRMHYGSFMLYGHVHGTLPLSEYRTMDVGIDTRPGMTPYSWREIYEIMNTRNIKPHYGRIAE